MELGKDAHTITLNVGGARALRCPGRTRAVVIDFLVSNAEGGLEI
jgi:hypothetical protein